MEKQGTVQQHKLYILYSCSTVGLEIVRLHLFVAEVCHIKFTSAYKSKAKGESQQYYT